MQNFEVNQVQILYDKPIGCGQFTKVYQAIDLKNKQTIACKEILTNSYIPAASIENELQVLASNQGSHIIKYYGCQQNKNKVCIFMEYSKYGDLAKYLEEFEYSLQIEEILKIFRQVLEGYKILFENNVIHRDLKLENILVFGDIVKITDFGTAKYIHPFNSIEQSLQGTLGYFSPQLLSNQENGTYKYTYKTDIFSLGVLLFHMIYGTFPWKCQNFNFMQLQDEYEQVLQVGGIINYIIFKPVNQFDILDKDIKQCIISMLEFREEDRISFEDLYNHKIFLKLDQFNDKSKRQSIQFSGLAVIDTQENQDFQAQKVQIQVGSTIIENISQVLTETWNIVKLLDQINDHLLEQGIMQDKIDLLYFYLIKIKMTKLQELENQVQLYEFLPQFIKNKIQGKKYFQSIINSSQIQEIVNYVNKQQADCLKQFDIISSYFYKKLNQQIQKSKSQQDFLSMLQGQKNEMSEYARYFSNIFQEQIIPIIQNNKPAHIQVWRVLYLIQEFNQQLMNFDKYNTDYNNIESNFKQNNIEFFRTKLQNVL
ncbi:hypothetical protein ABPG74_022054 [Tetrahymena malaccensis]